MSNVSTLICTMNRPMELKRALVALVACDPQPKQIIVSDDSPETDRRSQIVCSKFDQVVYRVGPRCGLSANRNAAVGLSTSPWLHFIDDDVIVPQTFYQKCHELLKSCDEATIVTGRQVEHADDGSVWIVDPPRHGFWMHMRVAGLMEANCVVMNAAIFPKCVFERISFDEFLKYGCEESDFSISALFHGFKLEIHADLIVDHFPSTLNRSQYDSWIVASQVYAGLKRQWRSERHVARTIAFLTLAVPRLLISTLSNRGFESFVDASCQAYRGTKQFVRCIERTQKPTDRGVK